MKKYIALLFVVVALFAFAPQESQAQYYRGGGFNRGFYGGRGFSVGVSSFRPGFSRSFARPYYGFSSYRRPVYSSGFGGGFSRGFGGFGGGFGGCGF